MTYVQKHSGADDLLIGRVVLSHAIKYLTRWDSSGLECLDSDPFSRGHHIEGWKAALAAFSPDDAWSELLGCPYCSAVIGVYHAKKLMKQRLGIVNRTLFRVGNSRRKGLEVRP